MFVAQLAAEGKVLPGYVHQEFEAYLKCGHLEHGLLRVQCDTCHNEQLVAFSCKRRGFDASCSAQAHGRTCRPAGGRGATQPADSIMSRRQKSKRRVRSCLG